MKIFPIITAFVFLASAIFAETDTNAAKSELLQERQSDKIVLPDIKLSIEDQSTVPLQNQTNGLPKDTTSDFGKIDMDELSRTKASDKLRLEILDERKKDNFSLSTFKFYYGMFDNLLAEVNTGKNISNLNYLFTYLRNKRGAIGYTTNTYFNTEMDIDDLNADCIYGFSKNLELSLNAGYYTRDLGLFTNLHNLGENKRNVPVKAGTMWNIDMNSTFKAEAGYDYLDLTHKLPGGYSTQNLWDSYADVNYEANWSKDNFLKINGKYLYADYQSNIQQNGRIGFSDRFPIFETLAVQAGGDLFIYNNKNIFWYPTLIAFYQYSPQLSLRGGVTGEQDPITIERLMGENQMEYHPSDPDEKWTYLAGATYKPVKNMSLRGDASYQAYQSLVNYQLDTSTDLYHFQTIQNTSVLVVDAAFEWIIVENLTFGASYQYRYPALDSLLFFPQHIGAAMIDYKQPAWGFEASSRLAFHGEEKYQNNSVLPNRLIWDMTFSKTVSKDIFAEIKLNNILNQENFSRPSVPDSGFVAAAGIRILL